jgi:SAM-dependent methyltransferase
VRNQQRAESYSSAFPKFPPLRSDDRWIDGVWMLGNNYKGSGYYGAYPPGYLARIGALFPDVWGARVLHPFAGSLRGVHGVRVDINPANQPDVVADACAMPFAAESFDLLLADPPYSPDDAKRYGVPMIDRRKALREFARVTRPGGYLVWLDTVWPMFAKRDWHCFGQIGVVRSTNHRVRLVSLFRREAQSHVEALANLQGSTE